jgi:hypothetical protein
MVVVVLIFKLPPTRARPRSQSTYFAWAPEGMETNWIPTAAGKDWFPYFQRSPEAAVREDMEAVRHREDELNRTGDVRYGHKADIARYQERAPRREVSTPEPRWPGVIERLAESERSNPAVNRRRVVTSQYR